jgi:hypothetical protein
MRKGGIFAVMAFALALALAYALQVKHGGQPLDFDHSNGGSDSRGLW